MASKKKLLAEGKKRLTEKLASVEEQANYMHTFIDDIVSKACSDARVLVTETDKSFLKHYSKANQELEGCLDKLFLIQASLPTLNNDLDTDCSDEEQESVSDKPEGQDKKPDGQSSIDSTRPVVLKTKLGPLPVEDKTPCVDDVSSVSSGHGISCHGTVDHKEVNQHGSTKMIEGISEMHGSLSCIKGNQSSTESMKEQWFEIAEKSAVKPPVDDCQMLSTGDGSQLIKSTGDVCQSMQYTVKSSGDSCQLIQSTPTQVKDIAKQLVISSCSFVGNTSNQPVIPIQHQTKSDSNFMNRIQPDTISKLLQQSARQPRIPNTTFADGTVLEVLVTEVVSPSIFWIQPISSPLAALMQKISLVYSEGRGQMLTIPVIGMACCSCFTQDSCWYRARIIDIFPSGSSSEVEVKVVYVDYGNCERLPLNRLRYLLPELAALQAQAVCAGLAKVKPLGAKTWNHEQTLFFVKLVVNQKLTAKVSVRVLTQAPLVDLTYDLMANQTGGNVFTDAEISPTIKINVAELLIANGQAALLINNVPLENSCASTTTSTPSLAQSKEPSPPKTAPENPTPVLSPKTKAKKLCERLQQKSVVHELNESRVRSESNTTVNEQPFSTKLSRSSSGVSSGTNLSCANKSPDEVHRHKDLRSDARSSFKIPNIPRMDVGICRTAKKEEIVRRGRGRGRGKAKRSSNSISDASSEESIPTGLTSRRNVAPRIPIFQKEAVIAKSVAVKETKPVDIPSRPASKGSPPSNKSSSPGLESPSTKITELPPPVPEPTSLAERKEKLHAGVCINISASHIISPTEFYSHIISCDARKLDYLMDELNDHFATSSSADANLEVAIGTICSAKYYIDDRWYRVEALEVEKRRTKKMDLSQVFVYIHYVDFGNKEWVLKSDLRKLPHWLFDLPPQVIRCSLAHVYPKKRQEKKDAPTEDGWSREDIEKFVDLTGYLLRLTAKVISTEVKSNMVTYNVIISSVIDGIQTCINDRLVTLGHAKSQVFSSLCDVPVVKIDYNDLTDCKTAKPQPDSTSKTQQASPPSDTTRPTDGNNCLSPDSAALEKWNPMTEDFVSQRNAYNIDVDDPGMATVGYKTENVHRICKFYAMGEMCYQGDNCKYVHSTELGKETVDAYWNDNPMPLPEEGNCVAMQIKAYHSACHFWAQLPYGAKPLEDVKVERGSHVVEDEGETLQSLVDSINHIYGKSSHSTHKTDLLLKADGELVCAKHLADNKWYRARVTSTNAEENTLQVFYLDYGNSEVVSESSIRPMLPQFLHLPFQAVECFLYNITAKEVEGKPDEARKVMEEMTVDKMLVALVKSSMASGTLHVVLIDTSGSGDIYIHQELIDRGVAVSTPYINKQPTKKKSKKPDPYAKCIPG